MTAVLQVRASDDILYCVAHSVRDPEREQEFKDAVYLSTLKSAIKGHNRVTCSNELREYLDENIPGWRDEHGRQRSAAVSASSLVLGKKERSVNCSQNLVGAEMSKKTIAFRPPPSTSALMPIAEDIVKRYKERGCVIPSLKSECRQDHTRAQEYKDASQLHCWKIRTGEKLTPEVLNYLNANMPGWRKSSRGGSRVMSKNTQKDVSAIHTVLVKGREIVRRCEVRAAKGNAFLPRCHVGHHLSAEEILERMDALKLIEWKQKLLSENSGDTSSGITWQLKAFLDRELKGWMTVGAGHIEVKPNCSSSNCSDTWLDTNLEIQKFQRNQLLQIDLLVKHNPRKDIKHNNLALQQAEKCSNLPSEPFSNLSDTSTYAPTSDTSRWGTEHNKFMEKIEQDGVDALLQLRKVDSPVEVPQSKRIQSTHSYPSDVTRDRNHSDSEPLSNKSFSQSNSPATTLDSVDSDDSVHVENSYAIWGEIIENDRIGNAKIVHHYYHNPTTSIGCDYILNEISNNSNKGDSFESHSSLASCETKYCICCNEKKKRNVTDMNSQSSGVCKRQRLTSEEATRSFD